MEEQQRSYALLAMAQAVGGGLTAGLVLFLYSGGTGLNDTGTTNSMVFLGLSAIGYYFSIHQLLKKKRLALSTLILTLISALNLILLIAHTGGLDSAFFSFWLLAIVISGIFGSRYTAATLAATTLYFGYELWRSASPGFFLAGHIGQLLAIIAAGALAEWVYHRWRRQAGQPKPAKPQAAHPDPAKSLALVNSLSEGVVVVDAERRIRLINHSAQALTGWNNDSARDIEYQLVLKLTTADDQPIGTELDPINQAWKSHKGVVNNNLKLSTKSDRRLDISLSVSPLFDDEGQPSGAIVLFRDISTEKEAERQRSEFVSTASHEMRTPIAALEGYIALAMNPEVATVDDRAMGYLKKAHETIEHLGQLFRDLLTTAKLEEGHLNEPLEPVDLTELLKSATEDMQFAAKKKGLSLEFKVSNQEARQSLAPLYRVQANPERLREVVMNLIDNAIKFTQKGGVTVSVAGSDGFVTVSVADTGPGIATEDIPHLFQKFYRVDNSATRSTGGTGLGLYLARNIIEHYQGRIWIESTPGEGAIFRFNLPRLRNEDVPAQPAEPELAKVS